jgi:ATP-dependent DNA ligase
MNAIAPSPKRLESLWEDTRIIVEQKFDGVRILAHFTNEGIRFTGRNAGVEDSKTPLEKTSHLKKWAGLIVPELLDTVLDGELLSKGMTAAELSGYLNLKEPGPDHNIYLMCFDILRYHGRDVTGLPWNERRDMLEEIFNFSMQPDGFYISKVYDCENASDRMELYTSIVSQGGEGVMLKMKDALYYEGKRPANVWFKCKRQKTWDLVCYGFDPPVREYKGKAPQDWPYKDKDGTNVTKLYYMHWPGAIKFGRVIGHITDDELLHDAGLFSGCVMLNDPSDPSYIYVLEPCGQCAGITDRSRSHMASSPQSYIGKVIEVEAMEATKDGYLRHPRYLRMRTDKTMADLYREGSDQ